MKAAPLAIGVVLAGLAAIVWVFFNFGNGLSIIRGVTITPEPVAASTTPAPEEPHAKAKPKQIANLAKAREKEAPPASPVVETALAAAAPAAAPVAIVPPQPELPFPTMEQIRIGANASDLLAEFHAPSLHTSSAVGGRLVETLVYSPAKSNRETWVLLRDGQIMAKYAVPHFQ